MKQLIHWLEHSFAPKMNKINNNVWVTTLKDSIMQVLPFILLGSIFCFLTVPGEVFGWEWWPNFWTPFGWTMGLLSLFVAFLIPFNLMEKKASAQTENYCSAFRCSSIFNYYFSSGDKGWASWISACILRGRRNVCSDYSRCFYRFYYGHFRKVLIL